MIYKGESYVTIKIRSKVKKHQWNTNWPKKRDDNSDGTYPVDIGKKVSR